MVIGIIGESCTGKSTLADKLSPLLNAEIYSGKDYLRMAKSEAMAKKLFQKKLEDSFSGEHIIYVISEKEHLSLLPEQAFRVLMTAELDTIKKRFAQRMRGELPQAVATMLEKKHGIFDTERNDLHVVSPLDDPEAICAYIVNTVKRL